MKTKNCNCENCRRSRSQEWGYMPCSNYRPQPPAPPPPRLIKSDGAEVAVLAVVMVVVVAVIFSL